MYRQMSVLQTMQTHHSHHYCRSNVRNNLHDTGFINVSRSEDFVIVNNFILRITLKIISLLI